MRMARWQLDQVLLGFVDLRRCAAFSDPVAKSTGTRGTDVVEVRRPNVKRKTHGK